MKKLVIAMILMSVSLSSSAVLRAVVGGGVTSWADIVTAQSCTASGGIFIATDGTCVTVPSVSGPVTTGAIPVGSGSSWALISAVASGQPLLSAGALTLPAYAGYYFSGTAAQTYTFPSTSKTLASLDGVEVLSNKSITPRNDPITHSTAGDTVTLPNSDSYDWVEISLSNASPGAITIAAPTTGTPTAGRTMTFCLKAVTTNAPTSYAYSNINFSTNLAAPTVPSAFGLIDCMVIRYSGLKTGWIATGYNFGF